LEYLKDDGFPVEPMFYVPIIPMILVNGGKGIGTGFSTDILSYSVDNLISYLQRKLKGESTEDIVFRPQYKGFTGTCQEMEGRKYIAKGTYQKLSDKKVRITELPIGHWTDDFKQHVENLMEADKNKKNKAFVKDYNDMSTDTTVDIEITFNEPIDESLDSSNMYNNFEKLMKLYTSLSTNNMHLFNDEEKLMKFDNEKEIVDSYFPVRLKYYQKRKDYMVDALQKELTLLSNKARYIQENLDGEIDLRKKKREEILEMMVARKYAVIEDDTDYKYLLKMPMDSVSAENAEKLINDRINKEAELCAIQSTAIENMWLKDLDELKQYLDAPKTIKVKKMVKK
jgi:DNA topoisomerase-2